MLKKIIYKKSLKHRNEFQTPDNILIINKEQFFNLQVRHLKDPKVVRIRGIYLSKYHDPFDCEFYLKSETNQLISVIKQIESGNYAGFRILGEDETDQFLKHGFVGQD